MPATDPPVTPAPTVRQAINIYIEGLPPTTAPGQRQVIAAALSALLGPALDEPVANLTTLRMVALSGELKFRASAKTGRILSDSTFRRYVLTGRTFVVWAAQRWPRPAAEQGEPGSKHLGSLIRDLRAAAGLTRQQLGDGTVGIVVIKRVETGRQRLTRRQLDLLLTAPVMAGLLSWAEREGIQVELAPEDAGTGSEGTGHGSRHRAADAVHGGAGGPRDGGAGGSGSSGGTEGSGGTP